MTPLYASGVYTALEKLGKLDLVTKTVIKNPRLAALLPFLGMGGTGAAIGAAKSDEGHRLRGALQGGGLGLLLGSLGGVAGGFGGVAGGMASAGSTSAARAAGKNLQGHAWNQLGRGIVGGLGGMALGAGAGTIGGGLLGRAKEKTLRERIGI